MIDFHKVDITTSAGTLTPRAEIKSLEEISNRAARVVLKVHDLDRTKTPPEDRGYDISSIEGDDIVSIELEGVHQAFYGIVLRAIPITNPTDIHVEVTAVGRLGILGEKYFNRVVFNGRRDIIGWEVEDDLTSDIAAPGLVSPVETLKPLPHVEYFVPFGNYIMKNSSGTRAIPPNDNPKVWWNGGSAPGNDEGKIAIIFRPRGPTIEKMWFSLFDSGYGRPLGGSGNQNTFVDDMNVAFYDVIEHATAGLIPSTTQLTRRSGAAAIATLGHDLIETWQFTTVGAYISGLIASTGHSLSWDVNRTGSDSADIIDDSGGGINRDDLGVDRHLRLTHVTGAGGTLDVTTADPDTASNPSASGWVGFRFDVSSYGGIGHFEVRVKGPGAPADGQVAFRFQVNGTLNDFRIEHNLGFTTVQSSYSLHDGIGAVSSAFHHVYFRVRPERLEFDMWYGTAAPGGILFSDLNFEFINRDTFSFIPDRMSHWEFAITGDASPASNMNWHIGWFNGNESGFFEELFFGNMTTQVDFSDDPVDVEIDQLVACVLEMAADNSTTDGIKTTTIDPGTQINNSSEILSLHTVNGGTDWTRLRVGALGSNLFREMPFIVEYSDSWKIAKEGEEFVVDYPNNLINWAKGKVRTAVLRKSVLNVSPALNPGPDSFFTVRASEYINPSSGGIIVSANKMRVGDIVIHLEGLDTDSPITTVVIDAGFADDAFALGAYYLRRMSILESYRDLARKFKAVFFLTAEASPTLNFNQSKLISSATDNPTSWNPAINEYVLSMDSFTFSDSQNALIVKTADVGPIESDTWTTFHAIGKTPDIRADYTNWDLITELGFEKEKETDVFQNEEDQENLRLWVVAQNEIYGKRVIGGTIVIHGYGPVSGGRLDVNSIVRLINPFMANGLDLTGTANVFKVTKMEYESSSHQTTLTVSNIDIHSPSEDELEELRAQLQKNETTGPNDLQVKGLAAGTMVQPAAAYMTIFVGTEELLVTRPQAAMFVRDDGYLSFSAFIPAGVGTIPNDVSPIDKIAIYSAATAGSELASVSLTADPVYKWVDNGLYITLDRLET